MATEAVPTSPGTRTATRALNLGFAQPRDKVAAVRVVTACVIGVSVALSGFPPLNSIGATLHVSELPVFALLTPASLAALLALGVARQRSVAGPTPRTAFAVIALISLGGCLSLLQSGRASESEAIFLLGIIAPSVLFLAISRGGFPSTVLAGSFLTALTAALVRADLVFLAKEGLPTPRTLFNAKFSNKPYNFHYYTLGNPDHTATFLLLPFTVCLVWASSDCVSRRGRQLLLAAAACIFFTLILLYVRLPLLIALILALIAVMRSGLPRHRRLAILVAAASVAAAFALASPGHYLSDIFSTHGGTSTSVRLASLSAGLRALAHHLLTGVGLGQFRNNGVPAHSSVIQAGAEMGILGLVGLALLTVAFPVTVILRFRNGSRVLPRDAALAGAAVYVLTAAISAGADVGLLVGLVSIYGLTLALFAAIGVAPRSDSARASVGPAVMTVAGMARARLRRRSRSTRQLGWVAYGMLWLPLAAWVFSDRLSRSGLLTSTRRVEYQQLLAAYHHGFGPLVDMLRPGVFEPAGLTDDQGGYLFFPWLSSLFHGHSADSIIRTTCLILLTVTVAAYPIVIRRLTGSKLAALASPVLVVIAFHFLKDDGFYWFPAITMAMCIPWLLVFARERSAPLFALTLISAVAGVTQLFRSGTGLGILAGAMIVCLMAICPWRRKAVAIALLGVTYIALSSGILGLAYQDRAQRMRSYPVNTSGYAGVTRWSDASGHPFWHTAYIGLGVVPNRYGIYWRDRVGMAYARSIDPNIELASPRYETILRRRVLHILTTDPGFVARAEARKLRDLLADGLARFPSLLVMLPLALLLGGRSNRSRRYVAVMLPVTLVALGPPLVGIASYDYELPWLGLLAVLVVLSASRLLGLAGSGLAALSSDPRWEPAFAPFLPIAATFERYQRSLAALLDSAAAKIRSPFHAIARAGARVWTVGTQRVTAGRPALEAQIRTLLRDAPRWRRLYFALALVAAGFLVRAYLESWQVQQAPEAAVPAANTRPFNAVLPRPIRLWSGPSLSLDWTRASADVLVRRTVSMLEVTTPSKNAHYAVISPATYLRAGHYLAAVRGEVKSGGLLLGVLDVKHDKWLSQNPFLSGTPPTPATMPLRFTVPPRGRFVDLILSNFSRSNHRSSWALKEILITRAPKRS